MAIYYGLWAAAGAALWILFRWQWWRRVHYHTLLGRKLPAAEVHRRLIRALVEFDRVARPAGIVYWLDAGTLLGAYRDEKLIPWDDDLDVCVVFDDFDRLRALGTQLTGPYRLVTISRFWSIDKLVPGLALLFPCRTFLRLLDSETQLYIDIFSCAETAPGQLEILPLSYMHRPRDVNRQIFRMPRETIFPLGRIGFEGGEYPAPHRTEAYLQHYYGPDLAPDHVWDAERGRYVQVQRASQAALVRSAA
jgi:hypothetical protein